MKTKYYPLIVLLLLAACTNPIAGAAGTWSGATDKLSAADVQTMFGAAHAEDGITTRGQDWHIDMAADGAIRLTAGSFNDTGHATVRGDTVCSKWGKLASGSERCFHFARVAPDKLASYGPDGNLDSVFSLTKR